MRALTFSSYINAYSLYQGSRLLGVDLQTVSSPRVFPLVSAKDTANFDFLVFTEESSLARALCGDLKGQFYPEEFPMGLLDDKWAFADWLSSSPGLPHGLPQYLLAEAGNLPFPFLIKAKRSWHNGDKLHRGWICRSREDLLKVQERIRKEGLPEDLFFTQSWMGDRKCRVISVCGFFDFSAPCRNLACVVERIIPHSSGLSCSAAVRTIDDRWGVLEKTEKVLGTLGYIGPYELEFLVVENTVFVLELNPRFWMQHAIFITEGNGLLKRYYRLDTAEDHATKKIGKVVWMDGLHLIRKCFSLDFRLLRLAFTTWRDPERKLVVVPPMSIGMRVWIRLIRQRMAEGAKAIFSSIVLVIRARRLKCESRNERT